MRFLLAQTYTIENPLGTKDIGELFRRLSGALLDIAIPIAVVMYVWAGILLLTAGGKPENVTKAKKFFLYTTIGLVVIFIGGGFVSLIQSILNAGQ